MRLDAAQRIGAGDDDGAVARVLIVLKRDRFEPQHRRQQDLEAFAAQTRSGGLVVRLRAGNQNSHVSNSRQRRFDNNGRLHFATLEC
jgi:hypothetical protein